MSNHMPHRGYKNEERRAKLIARYEAIDARLGSSVGEGWQPIVGEAALALDKAVPGWWADQIKEKFGTLTMYIGLPHGTDDLDEYMAEAITTLAERKSHGTCEWCGEYGRQDNGTTDDRFDWVLTLCVNCRQARRDGRNLKREAIERQYMEQAT